MKCAHCGERLTFEIGKGWRHLGGGLYMMRCLSCGHKQAITQARCPKCQSPDWVDDHCALPMPEESP